MKKTVFCLSLISILLFNFSIIKTDVTNQSATENLKGRSVQPVANEPFFSRLLMAAKLNTLWFLDATHLWKRSLEGKISDIGYYLQKAASEIELAYKYHEKIINLANDKAISDDELRKEIRLHIKRLYGRKACPYLRQLRSLEKYFYCGKKHSDYAQKLIESTQKDLDQALKFEKLSSLQNHIDHTKIRYRIIKLELENLDKLSTFVLDSFDKEIQEELRHEKLIEELVLVSQRGHYCCTHGCT